MQKIATKSFSVLMASLVLAVVTSTASADPLNTRPVTINPGPETALQTIFNNITTGGPGIDVVADQTPFAQFTNDASGGAIATFVIALAGNRGTNSFGIYDAADSDNRAELFAGGDAVGDQVIVSFFLNGDVKVNNALVGTGFANPFNFGFYLDAGATTFFTEDDLNGGNPQALVFQGDNLTQLQIGGLAGGTFTDDEFIIAFEDLAYAGSDKDFNDLVVLVESLEPVPAPGALLLGVIGMGGIGWVRRRMA